MQATVFSQPNCQECDITKTRLKQQGYTIVERVLGLNATKQELIALFPRARTVPQVIIDGIMVGGPFDVIAYLAEKHDKIKKANLV